MRGILIVGLVAIGACASAKDPSREKPVDAPIGTPDDAPIEQQFDAHVTHPDSSTPMIDAQPIDAGLDAFVQLDAPDQGPFCSANNQCTVAGECCVRIGGPQGFCAPGTPIAGDCFPQ